MIVLTPSNNFHLLLLVASLFFLFLFPFPFSFQLSRLLWHFVCVIVAERSLYRSNKQSKQTQRRRFIGHAWLGILLLIPPNPPPRLDTTLRGCVHRRRPWRVGYIYGVYCCCCCHCYCCCNLAAKSQNKFRANCQDIKKIGKSNETLLAFLLLNVDNEK